LPESGLIGAGVQPAGPTSSRLALPVAGWRLFRLCGQGPGGRIGYPMFVIVALLDLASVPIGLRLIQWNADFFNALQKVDGAAALYQIGVFGILTAISASRFLLASFIRKHLQLRWRRALTELVIARWLADRTFWRLEQPDVAADNPDQRIAEDCRIFVEKLTNETLEVITATVALASYLTLLWSLSVFPLEFALFGHDISIPRYMVWAAPVYVAISSGMTHWLGAPLHQLAIRQQQREADFRFSLARLREFSEPIALSGGEGAEHRRLSTRFEALAANFRLLIRRDLILGLFTRPYMQTVLQIPLFLALPAFLAGKVTLGGLMQLRSAFQNVVTNLSYFIFSYRDLIELAAATRRLALFLDKMAQDGTISAADGGPPAPSIIERVEVAAGAPLAFSGLSLAIPGQAPVAVPDLVVEPGANVWLEGRSGIGKSTLIRAIAGLQRAGAGRIEVPASGVAILPQRVYLPSGTLEEAAAYPLVAINGEGREALAAVGLYAGGDAPLRPESSGLSGGEQQRLMLARLLVMKPDIAILDEPTSALDLEAERALFAVLQSALPATTFIIVAHREPAGLPIRHVIRLAR
jgi:putative ATP-binding cassette transporter